MNIKHMTLLAISALMASGTGYASPPAERQNLFNEFKQIESRSHQARIAILQEAEICIQQAQNREAYRACEEKEKAGREALREELKPQREALKAKFHAARQAATP
ncbi:MAG TPA: hypothetical protein ENO09_01990 [bacterium]|nr:hypothetical protein [bacterium]